MQKFEAFLARQLEVSSAEVVEVVFVRLLRCLRVRAQDAHLRERRPQLLAGARRCAAHGGVGPRRRAGPLRRQGTHAAAPRGSTTGTRRAHSPERGWRGRYCTFSSATSAGRGQRAQLRRGELGQRE